MYSADKSGFKDYLLNFHRQIRESLDLFKKMKCDLDAQKINSILYVGMGGSAIAGDLLYDVLFDNLKVPLDVVRGYHAPAYCNENTLVVASSYSGNTEETLSAVEAAAQKGAMVLAVTSGGVLKEKAQKNGWPLIELPAGLPPRQALGYLFFPIYHFFGHFDLINEYKQDLTALEQFIKNEAQRSEYPHGGGKILALKIATTLQHKLPVIYSTAPYLRTIARRWQNQLHENSKSLAFSNVLPEMNHNEIVGWEQDIELTKDMLVIFLENGNPHPRIKKRIELSQQIIRERGVQVMAIYSSGSCIMEKVFSLVVLGDWVSYYLAMAYKKDPIAIANIDYLKKEMAKN